VGGREVGEDDGMRASMPGGARIWNVNSEAGRDARIRGTESSSTPAIAASSTTAP
jgi:hypothetical protein